MKRTILADDSIAIEIVAHLTVDLAALIARNVPDSATTVTTVPIEITAVTSRKPAVHLQERRLLVNESPRNRTSKSEGGMEA